MENLKRNELIAMMKEAGLEFNSKMKNQEMVEMLKNSENSQVEVQEVEVSESQEKIEVSEEKSFLDMIRDEEVKKSNFEFIHEKYSGESEISMIDSLDKLEIQGMNIKEYLNDPVNQKSFNDNFEFFMIHRESRKAYYLFLYDINSKKEIFIMKNDSIMKNKIYLLKFSQFFEIDSLMIHYIKNDRKNQSREVIDRNSKDYESKIKKYSMI